VRQRRWAYLGVVSLLLAALVALRLRRRFRVVQIPKDLS
jgi:uncharacterized membrane protein